MGAARVEGHVAADGADQLAGRIGRVVEAKWGRRLGDVQIDDAGFNNGDARHGIEVQDAIEPVECNDDAFLHRQRTAGEAGAAAAGDKGHAMLIAELHGGNHLVGRLGQDNRTRPRPEGGQGIGFVGRQLHRIA